MLHCSKIARCENAPAAATTSWWQNVRDAYADHAARFWLSSDGRKALALAQRNLANRATGDAYQLVVEAALAAGRPAEACRVAGEALARRKDAALKLAAARAYLACGQPADADALLVSSPAPLVQLTDERSFANAVTASSDSSTVSPLHGENTISARSPPI